jgi:hypothetical protein
MTDNTGKCPGPGYAPLTAELGIELPKMPAEQVFLAKKQELSPGAARAFPPPSGACRAISPRSFRDLDLDA